MTPATKNRLLAVGAVLVAGAALAVIAWGNIGENLVYYWTPSEMIAQGSKTYGPTVRLGGVVSRGSITWNPDHTALAFKVADNIEANSATVLVACNQVPPQMFREGIGVVVEGTFEKSGTFKTSRLMVSHSNEYRAPKPGENTKDWQKSLETAETRVK